MKITGGCLCGALAYEAEVDENAFGICHCRDCQILSGSAFRSVAVVPPEQFKWTSGMPKLFKKVADSGNTREMTFCGDCGTHITGQPPADGTGYMSLRLATANEFASFTPKFETYCASRVPWLQAQSGTVEFDRMP